MEVINKNQILQKQNNQSTNKRKKLKFYRIIMFKIKPLGIKYINF